MSKHKEKEKEKIFKRGLQQIIHLSSKFPGYQ